MQRYASKPSYQTASPIDYPLLKMYASENRRWQTRAERELWKYLRGNRYKIKFRRQHIIGSFIADFVCLQAKLIIEVDGAYHAELQQQLEDFNRTRDLNNFGYTIVRFTNEQVEANPSAVAESIYDKVFELINTENNIDT